MYMSLKEWISRVVGRKIKGNLIDACMDGRLLLEVFNAVAKGEGLEISKDPKENIRLFLAKCLAHGMSKEKLFSPPDLYALEDERKVIKGLSYFADFVQVGKLFVFLFSRILSFMIPFKLQHCGGECIQHQKVIAN